MRLILTLLTSDGRPGLVSVIFDIVFEFAFLKESAISPPTDITFSVTKAAWALINKKLNKIIRE